MIHPLSSFSVDKASPWPSTPFPQQPETPSGEICESGLALWRGVVIGLPISLAIWVGIVGVVMALF